MFDREIQALLESPKPYELVGCRPRPSVLRRQTGRMRFTESERRVLADSLWNRYQELSGWIGGAGRHGLDVKLVCREEIDDIKRINRLMRRLDHFGETSRKNLKGGDQSHFNV